MRRILSALIVALSLASLSGPALAAVCAPTPALPDSERRTEYTISASTGPLNVNFQLYGDGVDYGNWVSVWVNGVALVPVTDFIVTSPSGPLANLCRPITDAQVTFTTAQTGTIEIEGSRRPRRTSQFSENAGVPARSINQVLSDMEAQLRERWDRQSRLVRTAPGDSVSVLPLAAARANGFLAFDNAGNPIIAPATTGPVLATPVPWTNTRLAKTAAYAAVSGDCGDTIALGGSAFYTLTINAASGYSTNCAFVVVNEDTTASKTIAISGLTSFKICPQQIITVFKSNNVWKTNGPYRCVLTGPTTFFVDPTLGNDANDGFAAGSGRAWQHIQNAIANVQTQFDLGGGNPIIQLAFGTVGSPVTYTESFTAFGGYTGGLEVTIQGNPAVPGAAIWNGTLATRDGSIIALNGIKFQGAGNQALVCTQQAVLDLQNMEFGTLASGVGIQVGPGCQVNYVGGTYVVSGNTIFHWQVSQGGNLTIVAGQTISVPNALTFTTWAFSQSGYISLGSGVTFTGTGAGAGSTGTKYNITFNGVLALTGATLPGASAGTTSTGGQAAP